VRWKLAVGVALTALAALVLAALPGLLRLLAGLLLATALLLLAGFLLAALLLVRILVLLGHRMLHEFWPNPNMATHKNGTGFSRISNNILTDHENLPPLRLDRARFAEQPRPYRRL